MRIFYFFATLLCGGALYSVIEVMWRGYTHPTMALVGGICFFLMWQAEKRLKNASLFSKAILCSFLITLTEFVSGCIINLYFHLGVWDYSAMKFNLLGQICATYSIYWFFLSIPALLVIRAFQRNF